MDLKSLIRLISLTGLVVILTTSFGVANAVTFTPPPDNATPSQGSGGASRGN